VRHDVSPPLRDLVKAAKAAAQGAPATAPHEAEELRLIPLPEGFKPQGEPDPVLQRTAPVAPEALAPTIINNFDGLGQDTPAGFSPCCAPPDTNGAIGLTQYVQWVNLSFAVFDKTTTNIILGPVDGNTPWLGFGGGCEISNDGDPIVVYDKLADRWVLSQFVVNGGQGPFLQCVAVSTTSDATGSYNRYAFSYSTFDDYPKMSVWPDAYYVTFNMFGPAPIFPFLGADACAYDRTAMLNGQAATQVCFQQGTSVGSLLPSDLDGPTAPPTGSPNFMMNFGVNSLNLFKFHVDFATPANSTFTGPTSIPVAAFTPLCNGGRGCVPQSGTNTRLDSLADRLMYRLAYRNFGDHESLVVNHAVAVDTSSGVRWYEIQNPNGTPSVAQQSTFAPDASFRWMGSMAMDGNGDIALGYSVSSSSTVPSIAFAGRLASDPASTLGAETTVINGAGAQLNGLTRWGDYSAMQVDPVDDCTFWYTTEYLKDSGSFNWNTRIANFKFPTCVQSDLTIALTHTGNFTQGQTGATYTITVKNIGDKDTQGAVTVTDTLPAKLTATAASGNGWSCTLSSPITCTRTDVLAAQGSYPPITLTVNVANDAPGTLTNTATVAGGGEKNTNNDTANDPTTIIQTGADLAITKVHSGKFIQGQTGTYTITVTNVGLSATSGTVTVTDILPAGLTANTASGTGWSCTTGATTTCMRSDALASNAAYPPITLTVNVANNAPGLVANTATVSGGGDTNPLNNTANDPTSIIPPPPDLTITKSHTGDFNQGQVFNATYTLTVNNIGVGPTIGRVSVTDTLPAGLTVNSIFGLGWFCNVRTVTCTRRDVLAAGSSYQPINLFVNVSSDAAASVINTATVSGGGEIKTDNDTATDPTTIHPAPDLTITKTHSPATFTLGQTGTYTITVSNSGHAPTSADVTVTDFLPQSMNIRSVSGAGWDCSGSFFVSCTRSDVLAAGSSYPAITVTVDVIAGGTSVINNATVSGGGEFNTLNDTASDPTNVNGPTLTIAKSHTGDFTVGQTGTYHITVGNTGTTATSGTVTVTDFLPFGLTAIAVSGSGWNCSLPPVQFVNCTRSDSLATGNSYPAITLIVSVINSSPTFTNTANVSGGGDSQSHSASDPTNVTTPVLAITKSHTGDFTVGQTGTYTLTVSNAGKVNTSGLVSLTDFLPSGLTATAVTGPGWNCQPLPTTFLNCSRSDSLHPGKSYPSITLTVSVSGGAPAVTNTASVTGGGDTLFHSANDLTKINGPLLAITKSHTGDFTVGQTGSYTITVSNTGQTGTSGTVTVNDFLPLGLTATAFSGAGWSCPGLPSSFIVTCTRSDALAVGSSYPALILTVSVNGGAPRAINFASVSGGGDGGFHSARDITKIIGPILDIKKFHDGDFTVGQTGGYAIVVTNNGQAATSGAVTVNDFLPQGLVATAISGAGWNCPGLPTSSVTCTRSDALVSGSNYPAILMTIRVDGGGPSATNFATVSGGGDSQFFHGASDFTKINGPILAITKSHTGDFTVGQPGNYTITVSNTGKAATVGTVTVTDFMPQNLTATATSGTGWNCSGTFFVNCTRTDALAAGSSYPPITVTVSVSGGGPMVTNSATVNGGGDFQFHTANDPTKINGPILAITKSHTGDFTVGQPGSYTITVSNVGQTATVGDVNVGDSLPQGMSATAITGSGWNCTTFFVSCTRSDSLAANSSYPPITLTVNVTGGVSTVTNRASVNGGGDSQSHTVGDPTNVNAPVLSITASHSGNFTVGQTGSYTITASNIGTTPTSGGVTMNDFMPQGLTVTAVNASGWNCFGVPATFMSCNRSDSLAGGASYPPITLTVSVDPGVQSLVVNQPSLSGGGDNLTHTANDPTLINLPDLAITKSHTGAFTVGQPGTYTITVSNVGAVATAGGTINVVDFIPSSMTATAVSGQDWNCSILQTTPAEVNCTRSAGVVAQGGSYPPITLTVNVAPDAPSSVTNVAGVFGVGDADFSNNFTFDNTTISGFRFVPVTPCRIADTRNPNGPFGGPFIGAGTTRGFTVPDSACGIPSTAQAYSINATVVPKGVLGFLTMFPCGQALPLASTLNSIDGRIKAGAAILPAGTGGAVCAFASDDTELVLDINGYFVPASNTSALEFYPVTPCRLVDTRGATGALGGPSLVGNTARSFPIRSSSCNVPSTAQAYSLNYTSVPKGNLGFLTTWPTGQTQPLVSTLNAPTGAVTANAAIVPAGTNGDVSVFVTNDSDVVIDIDGYFAPPGVGGLSLFPLSPCRVLDTRNPAGSQPFNGAINVDVTGSACPVPASAQAFVLNATVVPPGPLGFLTLWPQGATQPTVSTLNAIDGTITSNMAIVPTTNGSISVFGANPTHLVLDISAYFAP
jgi:uncharacterized repeat protein (TIGR01451 family)